MRVDFMNKYLSALKVLRGLSKNKVISAMFDYCGDKTQESFNTFVYEIYKSRAENDLLGYIERSILLDENAFSVGSCSLVGASQFVENAFISDVGKIFDCFIEIASSDNYSSGSHLPLFADGNLKKAVENLSVHYFKNGYGIYLKSIAFKFDGENLSPIEYIDTVQLTDLKDYHEEKKQISDNIRDFLNGYPYSNMLLYGDRGTGKSSTVHAMLNNFAGEGLRLIEVDRAHLDKISKIRQSVAALPTKFIIFIDDLSLDAGDDISTLKAEVEGSVIGVTNSMIVATSNRRHVVKETFTERDNSVHPQDSIEEELSLSDRFGLTVYFASTDKESYKSIVLQLASDMKLKTDAGVLLSLAERWAIENGGRSPRRARQFADFVSACEKSGREIEF